MDINWLQEQVRGLELEKGIEIQDIPDIDLYMDQLITLFENKLKHTKRYEEDKLLTKTMINNYTKDKVIMPAVKKKYTKDHIILMVLLYQFKSVTSIGDIKELFSLIKEEEGISHKKLTALFEAYKGCKEKEIGYFNLGIEKRVEEVNEQMHKIGENNEELETALLVATLLEQANYHKRLAEKIIDEYTKKKKVE